MGTPLLYRHSLPLAPRPCPAFHRLQPWNEVNIDSYSIMSILYPIMVTRFHAIFLHHRFAMYSPMRFVNVLEHYANSKHFVECSAGKGFMQWKLIHE